jgi:hypothetical protein
VNTFNGGVEILAPLASDSDRAESILNEITKILGKNAAVMVHKPDCIVLAVAQKNSTQWRAIAQIELIAPDGYRWRPVEWNPSKVVTQ